MSRTKHTPKISGMVTNAQILRVLALNEDFAQYDLPKKIDKGYRQVIRCLHNLRDKHLIYLKRTEQSKMGGKEKNFWAITFYGLMDVLKYLDNDDIDQIAQRHANEWLVFAEWSYLLKKGEKWLYVLVRGVSYLSNSLRANVVPKFFDGEISAARTLGFTQKQWEELDNEVRIFVLERTKQKYTDIVLGLDYLFGGDLFRFFSYNPRKTMLIKAARRDFKLFSDNRRIREYIDKRFEQEKIVHKLLGVMETQWKKTKKDQAL